MTKEKYLIVNDIPLLFLERNVSRQMLIEIWLSDNIQLDKETLYKFYFGIKENNEETWRQYIR